MVHTFSFDGKILRAVNIDGEAWIVFKDVKNILALTNVRFKKNLKHPSLRHLNETRPLTGIDPNREARRYIGISAAAYHSTIMRARRRQSGERVDDFHDWMIAVVFPTVLGADPCFVAPRDTQSHSYQ